MRCRFRRTHRGRWPAKKRLPAKAQSTFYTFSFLCPPFSVESPRTVSNRDGILKPQPRNGLFHRDYYIQIIMNVNNFSILQILLLFQFYVFSPWTFQGGYLKLPFAPVLFLCIFILYISHHSLPRFPMVGQFSLSTCPLRLFCSAGKGSWNFVFFLAQK